MKKIHYFSFLILCLLLCSSIYAQTSSDGFYAGGQIGYDVYRVRDSFDVSVNEDFSYLNANPSLTAKGFVGGLLLGYKKYFYDCFYLALEAYANVSRAQESVIFSSAEDLYTAKIRSHATYGLALLPGLNLGSDFSTHLRLGLGWTTFKIKETVSNLFIPADEYANPSKKVRNWNVGIGFEKYFCPCWSYRADYIYSRFKTITTKESSRFQPSNNQFMLSLLYHFG